MVQQSKKIKLKVQSDKYYYVDLKKPLEPKVLMDSYINTKEAQRCFDKYLNNPKRYFLIKGEDLLNYRGQYLIKKPPYSLKVIKHDYKKIKVFSRPDKPHLRRMQRRRIRVQKIKDLGIKRPKVKWEYPEGCITKRQKMSYREYHRRKFYKQFKHIY